MVPRFPVTRFQRPRSHAYCIIDEFKISSANECPVENLWIKVTKGCNKHIIGAIYWHPGYKSNTFIEKLDDLLAQITKRSLPYLIAGDVNIDLKNSRIVLKLNVI